MTDTELYDISEFVRGLLFRQSTKDDNARNGEYKRAFEKFAESGWIPPHLLDLSIPDIVELSKHKAQWIDDYIYSLFVAKNFHKCKLLIKRLKKYCYDNPQYYTCAMILYRKKEYMGCCMMIFALIEQTIIYSAGTKGAVSARSKEPLKKAYADKQTPVGGYPKFPTEYLMTAPLEKVLSTYFKNIPNFTPEPSTINRNFLMHGRAKREYTHRDCIKLFVILDFIAKYVWEEKANAKPTT